MFETIWARFKYSRVKILKMYRKYRIMDCNSLSEERKVSIYFKTGSEICLMTKIYQRRFLRENKLSKQLLRNSLEISKRPPIIQIWLKWIFALTCFVDSEPRWRRAPTVWPCRPETYAIRIWAKRFCIRCWRNSVSIVSEEIVLFAHVPIVMLAVRIFVIEDV